MELYLIKDQTVVFETFSDDDDVHIYSMWVGFSSALEPVTPEHEDSKEYCKIIGREATGQSDSKLDREFTVALAIPISISYDGWMQIDPGFDEEPYLFEALISLFEEKNLNFHLALKETDIRYSCGCVARVDTETKVWSLDHFDEDNKSLSFYDIKFPEHELHPEATIDRQHPTQCKVTITVKLNQDALAKVPVERQLQEENPADKCKRLLDEAIGSDLVIVAANGAEVKAHKSLLMVSCDAFRAMFENKMKEGTTNRLEMPDMSEAGVRALLRFIYTNDLEAASEDCDIVLELFRAGDKYGMLSLKKKMKTLICSNPAEWFNVDTAVRLSLLVQDMEEEKEEILKKMAEVLKWYSKNSFEKLVASEEYVELFKKYPEVAMKLVGLILKFA